MTNIEIAYYRQEWVNDHAVDLPGGRKVFAVDPLTEEMYYALGWVASAETDCEGIEEHAAAYLQDVYVFTWDGPFYIRLVIDGIESNLNLLEGQHAVLDEWLEKTPVVRSLDPKKTIASAGWDRDDELALAQDFISSLGLERQWGMYLARVAAEEAGQKAS